MSLSADSLHWAIDFVSQHSDGDLFPKVLEMQAVQTLQDDFISQVGAKPLSAFKPGAHRRFIVPKDEVSYRVATQLDPQDSILLSAIIHEYGNGLESRRLPPYQVFSYRFSPTSDEGFYSHKGAWNKFWSTAYIQGGKSHTVLYCDIADFYNQIYHHVVENQLIESGFPNQAVKWLIALLESTTAQVSRGVPIGPHAVHLIAEATLIPIDNSMATTGLHFLRYADDIFIFCNSQNEARQALASVAAILDKQQRLILQRHKTKFLTASECQKLCLTMIEDRPISDDEDAVLKLIFKYSGGNPYKTVWYNQISEEDWMKLTEDVIAGIITDYLTQTPVDYIRLSWFYRRMSQIGHPGAIEISLTNIERLGPCFANVCSYFASVQTIEPDDWRDIGAALIQLLDSPEVKTSEFFRLSILSLFSKNAHIDHFPALASRFQQSDPYARREILLAAKEHKSIDWIRQYKEHFGSMDPWQQRAVLYGASGFPPDERKFFINQCVLDRPFDMVLAKWAKG